MVKVGNFSGLCYLWMLVACAITVGCHDDEDEQKDAKLQGAVRAFGETLEEAAYFDIGVRGGVIESAEGGIRIEIPEGALSADVTVGLQAVENTAPNGTGHSYRLTPHDLTFQKPVTITMMYGDSVSFVDGLGIAYQDSDGIWYWPGISAHDTSARKITAQATHFSDWSIFQSIKISPTQTVVEPGGEVRLTVLGTFPEDVQDDLLTPLVPQEAVPLAEPEPMDPSYINKWTLRGAGTVNASGNTAVYKAPAGMPDNNTAVVYAWLTLPSGKSWTLMSTIVIGGSEIVLSGGPYSEMRAVADRFGVALYDAQDGMTVIHFTAAVEDLTTIAVTVMFPGNSTGRRPWRRKPDCAVFTAETTGGRTVAGTIDTDDHKVHEGFIEVTKYGRIGDVITGTFSGGFTFLDSACDGCPKLGSVQGKFTALRFQ